MVTKFDCIDLLDRKSFNNKTLKIFNNIYKDKFEIKKSIFNNALLHWLNNTNIGLPGCKLHPNLLRYIHINLKLPIVCEIDKNKNKTFCYIYINNTKKKIRTQDYFSYNLIFELKKLIRKKKKQNIYKKIYKQLFEYDKNMKITKFKGIIENPRLINSSNPKRTDLEIKLFNNEISIIFEFLEIRSHNDFNQYEIDEFRLYKITKNHDDIKATWLILEKTLIKKGELLFFFELVEKTLDLITNLYLLEDEETFIVGNLELITNNIQFSKMLYKGHSNYGLCNISKHSVDHFIMKWKNNNSKH